MKLATVAWNGSSSPVLVKDGSAALIRLLPQREQGLDVLSLIRDPLSPAEIDLLNQSLVPLESFSLLPPILHLPKHVLCVGKNYRDHVAEGAKAEGKPPEIPTVPIWFTKPASALIGSGSPIHWDPSFTQTLDYEGELAVIIGKRGRRIDPGSALSYVFGYSILNDVTARDVQQRHKQWFKGKSADTYAPFGPVIVTADEIPDYRQLRIRTYVGSELRQYDTPANLIFDLPTLIADLSQGITLDPGDVIATGTPAGVGWGMDPPRYLQAGDQVSIQIDEIGTLANSVILSSP